jgi:hypothetical protein
MNRIILIGNGFDLAHGLKTSYKDFIDWLWKKEKKYFENKDNYFLCQNKPKYNFHSLGQGYQQEQNYYFAYDDFIANDIGINQYNNTESPFSVKFDENNIINRFLLQLNSKLNIQKWVDVENEYYDALKSIIDNDVKLPNNIHYLTTLGVENIINSIKGISPDNMKWIASIDYLNDCFNKIKIKLEKYLTVATDKPIKKIAALENFIFSKFDFADFTKQGNDNLIDMVYQKILSLKEKDEKQKLSIFNTSENTLNFYDLIKAIVSKKQLIHKSLIYSLDTKEDFINLLEHNKDIKNSVVLLPENVLFLNFNYTNTENEYSVDNFFANKNEGYKREFKINQETVHIHGELNNQENPLIFGYGDELDDDYKQILKKNDNNLLENVKSIKYGETYNYKRLLNFVESGNYQVFVIGHSCGNSDRTLLNTLFEHKNCQSIKIFYHEEFNDQGEKINDDFSDIYRNITRNFKNFADLRAKVVDKTKSIPFPQLKKNN